MGVPSAIRTATEHFGPPAARSTAGTTPVGANVGFDLQSQHFDGREKMRKEGGGRERKREKRGGARIAPFSYHNGPPRVRSPRIPV